MMDAKAISKQVDVKFTANNELHSRMDEDFLLWQMKKSDYDTALDARTKKHATDIEIISNDLRTNCDDVQSILSSAERQIVVRMAEAEGEDKREDIAKLERLFAFAFEKADERLIRLLLPPLRESLIWCSLVRGWTSGRFLVWKDNGDVVFDFMALDPRWLTYEVGADGLLWTGYKTFRSREALKDEYVIDGKPYEAEKKQNNPVIDYWKYEGKKSITNSVICGEDFLKPTEEYKLKSIPILIMPITTRPPVSGASGESEIAGYGESLFASTRDINGMHNRFASMVASHANRLARQAMINYKTKDGVELKTTTNVPDAIINLSMGDNKLEPSPMREISLTVVNMMEWLNSRARKGMLPDIPIGRPPPSGTLYNLVQEQGNKIFNPQLRNLNYFYADICRLIEEQLLGDKIKVKIKGEDRQKYFETQVTPVDLKKPHIIKVEFTARTPWSQLDTYQVADMAKRVGLPDGFIQEHILKLPDPKGLGDQSAIEIFEHSPKGAMLRAIKALMKAERWDEAEQIMSDLFNMEMEEQGGDGAGGTVPQEAEVPPPPVSV
ncbi:MAG: hypothetical protein CMI54_02725 [Parcubacteria group bacterium]|nr:hypothetical protein [Parcubacteria group bacterium]|tara:strand:- start:29479 stop:31137 length:1659 start_codon:yes stop_codon:yes gene_type:complete